MVEVNVEPRPAFSIIGQKTFITSQDQFATFWSASHENGVIGLLNEIRAEHGNPITQGTHIGLSCTEKDPTNRDFYFYVAVEYPNIENKYNHLETHNVLSFDWAIFSKNSRAISALIECEMYAFKEWLPSSGYKHAFGPEMEVYHEGEKIEFWLPVLPV